MQLGSMMVTTDRSFEDTAALRDHLAEERDVQIPGQRLELSLTTCIDRLRSEQRHHPRSISAHACVLELVADRKYPSDVLLLQLALSYLILQQPYKISAKSRGCQARLTRFRTLELPQSN